jgi:hypothetical protein
VFASELENLIEGDVRTAEPHDVRQVWVATKVAGTEGFSLKGGHGRYVLLSYLVLVKVLVNLSDWPIVKYGLIWRQRPGIYPATNMDSSARRRARSPRTSRS